MIMIQLTDEEASEILKFAQKTRNENDIRSDKFKRATKIYGAMSRKIIERENKLTIKQN